MLARRRLLLALIAGAAAAPKLWWLEDARIAGTHSGAPTWSVVRAADQRKRAGQF